MGSQKHTSILKHADEDGSLAYALKCQLLAQVPRKNRIVKMEMFRTSSRTKSGKLLARACIPMFQLMGFSKGATPIALVMTWRHTSMFGYPFCLSHSVINCSA